MTTVFGDLPVSYSVVVQVPDCSNNVTKPRLGVPLAARTALSHQCANAALALRHHWKLMCKSAIIVFFTEKQQ